jgi:hypothetical protein
MMSAITYSKSNESHWSSQLYKICEIMIQRVLNENKNILNQYDSEVFKKSIALDKKNSKNELRLILPVDDNLKMVALPLNNGTLSVVESVTNEIIGSLRK